MPEKVYQAADGVEVHLSLDRWVNHILDEHKELLIDDLEDAILRPVSICQHLFKSMGRVYEGVTKSKGFVRGNLHPVAIVEMRNPQVGDVITLYLSGRYYRGVQLWP
jgi:hypothetical protein